MRRIQITMPPLSSPSTSKAKSRAKAVVLLTDFGLEDWYVGVMKGVIASISPDAPILDISHQIPPGNVEQAAFMLRVSYAWFPEDSIFCAVVDPGVGSERRILSLRQNGYTFLAPDNGLLSLIAGKEEQRGGQVQELFELSQTNLPDQYIQKGKRPSSTFHGRDIFAPLAAHLAQGQQPEEIGAPVKGSIVELVWPKPQLRGEQIWAKVLYIDHFGNIITNVNLEELAIPAQIESAEATGSMGSLEAAKSMESLGARLSLQVNGCRIEGLSTTYADKGKGEFLLYVGSCNFLEVGCNQGNAAALLKIEVGSTLQFSLPNTAPL